MLAPALDAIQRQHFIRLNEVVYERIKYYHLAKLPAISSG